MRITTSLFLLLVSFVFTGCYRYGIYQHPMILSSNPYHAIPLAKDSSKSALYAGGSIMLGTANHQSQDDLSGIQGTLHRGTNFGSFQAHYGLNGTVGLYHASDYGDINPYYYNSNLNNTYIDSINGTKLFGSLGFSGGINVVVPFESGGEWRVIGVDFSHQYEWDNAYAAFRKKIPLTDANVVEYTRHYSTLALSSEILFKVSPKENLGYKLLVGASLGNPRFFESYSISHNTFRTYISQYVQYSFGKGGFYVQGSVGYYSFSGMLGFNLRLQ